MLVRKLDDNHDMTYGQGRANFVNGAAAVGQAVYTRLLMLRGEWFLDTDAGVPYLTDIMTKPVNLARVESAIKQIILETDGVNQVRSFSMVYDNTTRSVVIAANVVTDYDDIQNITVRL